MKSNNSRPLHSRPRGNRERDNDRGGRRDGPSTAGRGQPETDAIITTRSGLCEETFILYHLIWNNLLCGPASASSTRRPIPLELVRMIVRYAGLMVLDRTLTTKTTTRVKVGPQKLLLHSVWFYTTPLICPALVNISRIQLVTVSDHVWTSWTGVDVGVFPPPHADLFGREQTVNPRTHYTARSLPGRKVQDYFAEHDALWKSNNSHPVTHRVFEKMGHAVFNIDHELWEVATEGHVIAVRAHAQYPSWQNMALEGELKVWKYFEPVVPL